MTIELVPSLPAGVVGFIAKGEVTREDYEQTLIPAVEAALADHEKIRLLYVLGDEFEGITAGGAMDDAMIGLKHATRYERMAVVTDRDWIRHALGLFGHLVPSEVRIFAVADQDAATEWITS